MNILGIGPLELLFIFLIVLLVLKPEDIGKFGRAAGRTLNRIFRSDEWRMVNRAARDLRDLPNRLMQEAQLEELQKLKSELDETGQILKKHDNSILADLSSIDLPVKDDPVNPVPDKPSGGSETPISTEQMGEDQPPDDA